MRFFGWVLIAVAFITASAEAVLALGPGPRPVLATGDIWTLLSGLPSGAGSTSGHWLDVVTATVMMLPAWIAVGLTGVMMVVTGRLRRRRHRLSAFDAGR
ncbi:hypothetical protein [Roseospira navarrensis]|uniref:Uncharacterized protein n=1 Tax=Roseospira navarrensis TaxID=140058 RepID=A0A7X2D4E4_9PROT|nr:hypothetical protein [Roseospira navarrensis]MQX36532.1 hypothetical protein [Roseospira navarrensis]